MRSIGQIATGRLGRRCRALVGLVLAAISLTFTTAVAAAGTFRVELGLWSAGCAAQGWFATGMMGDAFCNRPQQLFPHVGWDIWPASQSIGAGAAGQWQINAPPGITITQAAIPSIQSSGLVSPGSHGWQAADYWSGGTNVWGPGTTSVNEGVNFPLNTSYYGFKLYCFASSCNNQG